MDRRELAGTPVVLALVVGALVAMYPSSQPGAAALWLLIDLALLVAAARDHRWALTVLTLTTAFGALLLIVTGVGQVTTEPRYLLRGLAYAVAAAYLVRQWRRYLSGLAQRGKPAFWDVASLPRRMLGAKAE